MYKLFIILMLIISSACATKLVAVSDADESSIYIAVIERLIGLDDSYGGNLNPHTVYIAGALEDSCKESMDINSCELINESILSALSSAISHKGIKFYSVVTNEEAKRVFKSQRHEERVAMIAFQRTFYSRGGLAKITVNAKYGSGASQVRTYILVKSDGVWLVKSSDQNRVS